jgi:hypothetical protein
MAISIDWSTKVITIPQADLTLVAGSVYSLDVESFREDLLALEASEAGMTYPKTHAHNTTVTLGGVTLARTVEIINGYTVTFEAGSYAVNLLNANNNIADVATVNGVSIRSRNSAGLQVVTEGGSVPTANENAAAVWAAVAEDNVAAGSMGERLKRALVAAKNAFAASV